MVVKKFVLIVDQSMLKMIMQTNSGTYCIFLDCLVYGKWPAVSGSDILAATART